MNQSNLLTATFVGIDAHPTQHTALAINRFEEEKGQLTFDNTLAGIEEFLNWLEVIDGNEDNVILGVEGGGNSRHGLVARLLKDYHHLYEVNPLYTKQRRSFGTRLDKSDRKDAKVIAEVLTKKLTELPLIRSFEVQALMLSLKKVVWFYEEITADGTAIQNQLHQLKREQSLSLLSKEKEILNFIISERKKQLAHVRKTQKKCLKEMEILLRQQGRNLTTVKGISVVLAAKIVAHSGGIERFPNLNAFIRYAGIAPRENSSGKTKRHIKNSVGNKKLNSALYLAAMLQLRWNARAKEYFDKKVKEGKTKRHALKCLMKRTACIIYGMLKGGGNYRG